jgi:hypothetical protein
MAPAYRNGNVSAICPDCKAIAVFDHKSPRGEYGTVLVDRSHSFNGRNYHRFVYVLMRCGGCGRGGLAQIHDLGRQIEGTLGEFFPVSIESAKLPEAVPGGIVNEFREGELCAAHGAYRPASALMRSVLEKALKDSGYTAGQLYHKVEEAAKDAIITDSRRQRAQDEIKSLGNDILHDEWIVVTEADYELSHHYAHRILEDLYDDRRRIVARLRALGRLPTTPPPGGLQTV